VTNPAGDLTLAPATGELKDEKVNDKYTRRATVDRSASVDFKWPLAGFNGPVC
jgi:hypothetical protein